MKKLILESPTRLRIPAELVTDKVKDLFRYEDLGVTHEWRNWVKFQKLDDNRPGTHWFVRKEGREALDAKVAELDAERRKSILFEDAGGFWTYSGMAHELAQKFGAEVVRSFEMPRPGVLKWAVEPPEPRWYQKQVVDILVSRGHGAAELATGLGKSLIAAMLLQRIGLSGIVVAPTLSIAEQLLSELKRLFGSRVVGQFFDGKKEAAAQIVVAVSKSLTGLDPTHDLAKKLAAKKVLIGDEAHLLPAETLSKVVLGMLGDIPYRFFLSGTQLRTDGLDVVLRGIVGEVVMRIDVKQGVDEGFLSRPKFFQFDVRSDINFDVDDAIKMNRHHLHRNENVYRHAGSMVEWALKKGRRPVVLLEEVSQFTQLLKYIGGRTVGFAHGGVDAETKKKLPPQYHKSNRGDLVARFDAGELDVLVGTQSIGTGTDIKSASFIIDLVGLASEIRVRQNVGRGTRLFKGKTDCIYCDYNVWNVPKLVNHAKKRAKIFEAIYGPVTYVRH